MVALSCTYPTVLQLLHFSHSEQDRQCTYNVTLRCVRVTIVAVKKIYVLQFRVVVCVYP
jgi:hypothetical protein